MKRVFHRADGGVSVMAFLTEDPALIARDTQAFLDAEPGATFEDNADLPGDRTFRNCWTKGDQGGVTIDMPKARTQVLTAVRVKRDADLAASDVELLRANEKGQPTDAIVAARQELRDLPAVVAAQLDKVSDPDQLKTFLP